MNEYAFRFQGSSTRRNGNRNQRRRREQLLIERLEDRFALANAVVTSIAASGLGSLAAAINSSNLQRNDHAVIRFDDTRDFGFGPGVYKIDVGTTPLPAITEGTRILGVGAFGGPVQVEIFTSATGASRPAWGIEFDITQHEGGTISGPNSVENVEIRDFRVGGILAKSVFDSATFAIVGNKIHHNGLNSAGSAGIRLDSAANYTINGDNQIYSNLGQGIFIGTKANSGTQLIDDNYIGTNAALAGGLGNTLNGIYLQGTDTEKADNWTITKNTIWSNSASAFDDAIELDNAGTGNWISENHFRSSAGLPIDIVGGVHSDSTNSNDPDDTDSGPNAGLNHPAIAAITYANNAWTVRGSVDANAASEARTIDIELYKYTTSGSSREYRFLRRFSGTLTPAGDLASWQTTFAAGAGANELQSGDRIVALLLDRNPTNTSEMSPPAAVPALPATTDSPSRVSTRLTAIFRSATTSAW